MLMNIKVKLELELLHWSLFPLSLPPSQLAAMQARQKGKEHVTAQKIRLPAWSRGQARFSITLRNDFKLHASILLHCVKKETLYIKDLQHFKWLSP